MAKSKAILSADPNTKGLMIALKAINKEAYPQAVAETLNITADQVTKDQIKNVKGDFTIRTPFTLKSQVNNRAKPFKALNKAKGKKIERMFSRAGTFSPYLWLQEEDREVEGIDGPVPIATVTARTSKSDKKAVAKRFRLKKNQALKPGNFGESGKQFIGKPGSLRYGLYERTKKGIRMLRNLESDKVKIKGTGFHKKAVKRKGNNTLLASRFKRIAQKKMNKAAKRG